MSWQPFDNTKSIYLQIMDQLILKIISGAFKSGSKLPTVRELAIDMGVNPNTMQRAFVELEALNIVVTKRTTGRFVTEDEILIKSLRTKLGKEAYIDFLGYMHQLGYSNEELDAFISEIKGELK